MVDRVSLSKLINLVLQEQRSEERRREEGQIKIRDRVTLSRIAQKLITQKPERDETQKKVEVIKRALEKGEYKVQDEKLLKGLEDFLT
ncbi:MAG: flagellar biosynthesis anti-sigma factor FlgM [Aquificae bacterium]|nr:flagellar biosynthesis anti-sigma factor FlgM [Aquificota bacterium]